MYRNRFVSRNLLSSTPFDNFWVDLEEGPPPPTFFLSGNFVSNDPIIQEILLRDPRFLIFWPGFEIPSLLRN